MEPFDIGLDGEEIEASPDFNDLPAEPPKKKIHRQQKSTTKKERDCLTAMCITLLQVVIGSKHRYLLRDIYWPCRLSADFNACRIVIVLIARVAAAGCCAGHVSFWFLVQVSFFRRYIHEIDTVNTFGMPPLTPCVLSTFTVISDETRKYFAIRVCTGYYRVGHFPLILYI